LCNAQELDKFYEENSNKFGYLNEMEGEDEEEERKEENNKLNQNWDEEGFNGNFDEENKYFYNEEWYGENEEEEWKEEGKGNNNNQQKMATTKSGNRNLKRRGGLCKYLIKFK